MQITLNISDNLPTDIVNQYIHNIEQQIALLAKATTQSTSIANETTFDESVFQ